MQCSRLALTDASALILTFLVDGKKDNLDKALAWEKTMSDFMLKWIDTEKPAEMDVAFNTERFEEAIGNTEDIVK